MSDPGAPTPPPKAGVSVDTHVARLSGRAACKARIPQCSQCAIADIWPLG